VGDTHAGEAFGDDRYDLSTDIHRIFKIGQRAKPVLLHLHQSRSRGQNFKSGDRVVPRFLPGTLLILLYDVLTG
jgi:hypothetical protein